MTDEPDYRVAMMHMAMCAIPHLEDILDQSGIDHDANEIEPCDADGVCSLHWCQSGGCVVDKLIMARKMERGEIAPMRSY